MKSKTLWSLLVIILLLSSSAMAYNLSLTPAGSTDVTGSSTFDVFVVFNADAAGNSLGTFGFNLLYDNSELTYSSYQLFLPSPIGPAFTAPFESPSGKINNLSGNLPFGATAPTISNAYTLAKITFGIDDPGVNKPVVDGLADVWFDTGVGTGITVDGQFTQMSDITLTGAPDVAVAPEPLSATLFIIGGVTLEVRRFYKKRAAV